MSFFHDTAHDLFLNFAPSVIGSMKLLAAPSMKRP